MNEELGKLVQSFSTIIDDQAQQLESGLRSLSVAVDQAATRLSAILPSQAAVGGPATAPAAGVPAGILSVRIVNEAPVPVTVTSLPVPQAPAEKGGGFWETVKSVAGGIGNFVGGLFGGLWSGISSPFMGLVDIIALIPLVIEIHELVKSVRAFMNELFTSLRDLVKQLFDEFTAAGIFPISRLIASLLFLIDRGVTLILTQIQPYVAWVGDTITAVTKWFGDYIDRVSAWFGSYIDKATDYLAKWVAWLIDGVIGPAIDPLMKRLTHSLVESLAGTFYAFVFSFAKVLADWTDWFNAKLLKAGAEIVKWIWPSAPITVPREPKLPDVGESLARGAELGRRLGRGLADLLVGEVPAGAGGAHGAPATEPVFRRPRWQRPPYELPPVPSAGSALEKVLTEPAPTAAPPKPAAEPVTVNGGVTVQVRAETVSMENAEATARVLAVHLVDELARLTQADRFRRGLPTGAVS